MDHVAVRTRGGLLGAGLLALAASCGGGAGESSESGRFCAEFNAAQCERTFECASATDKQDPFFVGFFGHSPAECAQRWTDLCKNPTAEVTADVTCRAGAAVNASKASACLATVKSATCAALDHDETLAVCKEVCGAAADGGAAASDGPTANSSLDGPGSSDASAAAQKEKFCRDSRAPICRKLYQCIGPADRESVFTMSYGTTVDECITIQTARCAGFGANCELNAQEAAMCLVELPGSACHVILPALIVPPDSCLLACWTNVMP